MKTARIFAKIITDACSCHVINNIVYVLSIDIDPPTVDLLLEATTDVAKWRILGLKLGLKACDLDCLHSTYHAEGVDTLKLKMFQEWLKRFPRASWDNVIKALKEMKENTVAEQIERDRHRQSSTTGNHDNYSHYVFDYKLHVVET